MNAEADTVEDVRAGEENCVAIFSGIMRVQARMMAIGEEVAGHYGLHIAELNVLNTLGRTGPLAMGELSRATFISPANTTHTVKKLEKRHLVSRRRSESSDRIVIVGLTPDGQALVKKSYPEVLQTVGELLDDALGETGREQMEHFLARLQVSRPESE